MDIMKVKRDRFALVTQAREILDNAEKAKRELSAEETTTYEALMADVDKKTSDIGREERLQNLESSMKTSSEVPVAHNQPIQETKKVNPRATEEYRKAFNSFLGSGVKGMDSMEYRALQADLDTSGGYLVAPEQFVSELIKALDNSVYMRQLARTFQVPKAESLGAPSLDTNIADPVWTSEILTGTEDSSMAFGKRELHPHPLAKLIKVSNTLLRKATMGAEAIVRDNLNYKFAIVEETAFMTGTGSGQPLGVFTASASGISTTYDVSTGNGTTYLTSDGLIEAKFGLKAKYWKNARWIFHQDAVKAIRKLKTGEGDYIWQPGISAGTPDRILEVPYIISEYAPSTFTSGLYVGIIGDFSYYWIADALDMQIQRLDELYAATNQVGFIGRLECDGLPVLGEAFRRVTLG